MRDKTVKAKNNNTEEGVFPAPEDRPPYGVLAALLTGLAGLYLYNVSRTPGWGDSTELLLVGETASIAHPTGYPLFSLLAWCASVAGQSNPAGAVNALSALFAVGAVALSFFVFRRLVGDWKVAVISTAALSGCGELVAQARFAEVYTLHLFFAALVLLLALRFAENRTRLRFALLCFAYGLSFTNHLTSILFVFPLLYVLWPYRKELLGIEGWRFLTTGTLGFLAGLLPYLYVPLRASAEPFLNQGEPATWHAFLSHVSGSQFHYRMGSFVGKPVSRQLLDYLGGLWSQFGPAVGLLPLGVVYLWRKKRGVLWLCLMMLVPTLIHALTYDIPDKQGYFLPGYWTLALGIGTGFYALFVWSGFAERQKKFAPYVALAVACVWMGGVGLYWCGKRTADRSLLDYARAVSACVEQDAILFVENLELYYGLLYLARSEGLHCRPIAQYQLRLPWYLRHLKKYAPECRIPAGLDTWLEERVQEIERLPSPAVGSESQWLVDEVKHRLIEANIDERPVFVNYAQDPDWKQKWKEYHLRYAGLAYRVHRVPVRQVPLPLQLPSGNDYTNLPGRPKKERYVAVRFSAALNRMGILYARQGEYGKALAVMRRSLDYEPDYPQAHKNIGAILIQNLGRTEEGIRYWEHFVEIEHGSLEAAKIRERIEQLQKDRDAD